MLICVQISWAADAKVRGRMCALGSKMYHFHYLERTGTIPVTMLSEHAAVNTADFMLLPMEEIDFFELE